MLEVQWGGIHAANPGRWAAKLGDLRIAPTAPQAPYREQAGGRFVCPLAVRCAPRELATAQSHLKFATMELDQGFISKAKRHLWLAEPNAHAAVFLSPPQYCAERGFVEMKPKPKPAPGDRDGDGYLHAADGCPHVPANFNGLKDEDGCPDEVPTDDKKKDKKKK